MKRGDRAVIREADAERGHSERCGRGDGDLVGLAHWDRHGAALMRQRADVSGCEEGFTMAIGDNLPTQSERSFLNLFGPQTQLVEPPSARAAYETISPNDRV